VKTKTCTTCGEVKPLAEFPFRNKAAGQRHSACRACRAEWARDHRTEQTLEERRAQMTAYRAGMRKDTCAVCGGAIEGSGICFHCEEHVRMLGGLEGLKRAVRAVRYLQKQ
jgi:hypothetical protein